LKVYRGGPVGNDEGLKRAELPRIFAPFEAASDARNWRYAQGRTLAINTLPLLQVNDVNHPRVVTELKLARDAPQTLTVAAALEQSQET